MSDSVVKLRIDSKEYDANIKRAGQALTDYFNKVKEGGGTLMHLDEGVMEAVQAMGEMGTMAKNAKGGLRELTQATTDMTIAYRNLTDEEKSSPLGQAMQQSIQQMTERASEIKDAMADVNAAITNAASDTRLFDQMAQGMSVASAGFQGLTGAGKLLGIQMGDDVEVIAKLQAAMAVTNSLTTIQTALQKQSAFMQGVMAAKSALAAAGQQLYAVATGEATAAQVAFNVAASANPYGLVLTAVGALIGVLTAFASTTGESTEEVKTAKTEMNDLTKSVNDAADAYQRLSNNIKNLGIGGQKEYHMRREALTGQYDYLQDRYSNVGWMMRDMERRGKTDTDDYRDLKEQHQKIKEEADNIRKQIQDLDAANKERVKRLNQYKRLDFSDVTTQAEAESAISFLKDQIKYVDNTTAAYKQLKRAIEYAEKTVMPLFKDATEEVKQHGTQTKKTTKIITGSLADLMNDLKFLQQEQTKATNTKEWETYQDAIRATQMQIKELKGELSTMPSDIAGDYLEDAKKRGAIPTRECIIAKGQESMKNFKGPGSDDSKDKNKKNEVVLAKELGKITSGVSGIFSGIESLGIELPQGLKDVLGGIQGVMSILTGISTIVSAIQAISTADAIIPFAGGGIIPKAAGGMRIPGNSFSGDNLRMIGVNSGELILNQAQQGVIAHEMQGGGMKDIKLSAKLAGGDIILSIDRTLMVQGKGQMATFK